MNQIGKFRRMDYIFERIRFSPCMMLALIILFGLILRLATFSGIVGGDDMIYTYDIYKFFLGNFEPGSSHWSLRLGFIFPTSLCARIFGFNEFALTLFPLICSIANIFLIYAFAKLLFTERIALYAAFLLSFFPLDVFFATMVFIDGPLSLFMGLVVFYFLKGEMQHKTRYYLLSGFWLGLAYLTKLTGLYIILFFLAYTIIEKKIKLQYGVIIVGFLAVLFFESGYYYLKTGNPVYRFSVVTKTPNILRQLGEKHAVPSEANMETSSFKGKGVKGFAVLRGNNWFIEPLFTFTTNQEFGFFYYFIFPIMIYLMIKKDKKTSILLIWIIPLLLYSLYGSVSPFHFTPLPRWPRYFSPITLPSLLILAYFLNEKKHWLWNKFSFLTTSFLLATSLICIFAFNDGPTDSYIVRKIAEFRKQNSQKSILVKWRIYQHLAPFLEYQKNLNIELYGFPENRSRPKGSLYYGIRLANLNDARDCYIVISASDDRVNPQKNHPNWKLIHSIHRPKKFFCPLLERLTFIPIDVKEHLCPNMVCEIYYIF